MRSPNRTCIETEVWAEVVSKVRPSWGPGDGEQTGTRVGEEGSEVREPGWGQLSIGRELRVRTQEGEAALLWSRSSPALSFSVGLPDRNTQFQTQSDHRERPFLSGLNTLCIHSSQDSIHFFRSLLIR